MTHLPETERAYLAGIIDGEGCISLGRRKTAYLTPTLQVTNTSMALLDWLSERYGGGIYERRDFRPTRKRSWLWSVAGQKAITAIRDARPYLLLKTEQADIILALSRYKPRTNKRTGRLMPRMTPENFAENELAVARMRKLNQRGVT